MKNEKYTPVPSIILDKHLRYLSMAEMKVLLIVVRQTLGWKKQVDWLSGSQLQAKTGCSRRAISEAIASLLMCGLIEITDKKGNLLKTGEQRRGKLRMYYRYVSDPVQQVRTTYYNSAQALAQKMQITI